MSISSLYCVMAAALLGDEQAGDLMLDPRRDQELLKDRTGILNRSSGHERFKQRLRLLQIASTRLSMVSPRYSTCGPPMGL
jgi:hypothetical protein